MKRRKKKKTFGILVSKVILQAAPAPRGAGAHPLGRGLSSPEDTQVVPGDHSTWCFSPEGPVYTWSEI